MYFIAINNIKKYLMISKFSQVMKVDYTEMVVGCNHLNAL